MKKNSVFITAFTVLTLLVLSACSAVSSIQQTVVAQETQAAKSGESNTSTPAVGQAGAGQTGQVGTLPATIGPALPASGTVTPILSTAAVNSTPLAVVPATGGNLSSIQAFESIFENIYYAVSPSVVNIHVILGSGSGSSQTLPFPFGQQPNSGGGEALGSGFVWDTQGHIVTNNHVIAGATSIDITFADGTNVVGKVVGTDPQSDLAVVQAVNAPANLLKPVRLGDSSKVKVGQMAIAIGNPFGLQGTMTQGIISALGRTLPVSQDTSNGQGLQGQGQSQTTGTFSIPDVIQTDAPINPGNSGGVLLNDAGEVIGVTAAISSPVEANSGVGFAIPSNTVQKEVPVLIQTGSYQHPYLGISGAALTPDIDQAMGLSATQRGVLIVDVVQGGPGANAGLQGSQQQANIGGQPTPIGGDVITAVNGQQVKTMEDLISYLDSSTAPGQTVTLTVLRNGRQTDVPVKLVARPTS